MNLYADLVFKNGQVITVNPNDDIVTSVASKDDKIIYVGNDNDADEFVGPHTQIIDLEGRTLTPGFNDAHLHMTGIGAHQLEVNLTYPEVNSIADIKAKVKEAASKIPKGEWIRCFGYNQEFLEDKRHPTRWDIDEVAPEHPVVLVRVCSHVSVFNSNALQIAKIADDSPDEPGGVFDRENGIVNGVMRESVHYARTKYYAYTERELENIYILANKHLIERGITSVTDAGGPGTLQLKALQTIKEAGKLDVRVYLMSLYQDGDKKLFNQLLPTGIRTGFGDDKLKIGSAKIMLDGSSSAPTSAVRRPYEHKNDGDCGILTADQDGVNLFVNSAHTAGFQVTSHAVGDKAVEMVITGIETALKNEPRNDHRHRIEHCGIVDALLVERIKNAGIIPIPQPSFIYINGEIYFKFYGEDRVSMMMALKSFLDADIPVAISSDCPVVPCEPMMTLYAACTRKSAKGNDICREQAVKPLEAIRMYTLNGAYASFEEDIKGSLEVGKLADFTVLSGAILDMDPDNFMALKPVMTVIGGKIVWKDSK